MARLRRRFTIVDHEDNNTIEVGPAYVLSPAKNPADLAAMHTLADNLEPELAADIRDLIDLINEHPDRELGSYGRECLAHVKHPAVLPYVEKQFAKIYGSTPLIIRRAPESQQQ